MSCSKTRFIVQEWCGKKGKRCDGGGLGFIPFAPFLEFFRGHKMVEKASQNNETQRTVCDGLTEATGGAGGGGGLEGTGEGVGVGALTLPEVPAERVQLEPKPARTSKRSGHKRLT